MTSFWNSRRPSTPPCPSPLRCSSSWRNDQLIESSPARPSQLVIPPATPQAVRPPSPKTLLRPPQINAQTVSRRELHKVDCERLERLLSIALDCLQNQVQALSQVAGRINDHWSLPQRATRVAFQTVTRQLIATGALLAQTFTAVSVLATNLLEHIACRDQRDLETVSEALTALDLQHAALEQAEDEFGVILDSTSEVLQQASEPDDWKTGDPLSPALASSHSTHRNARICYRHSGTFLRHLAIGVSTWQAPLLSPSDQQYLAEGWRIVENGATAAAGAVETDLRALVDKLEVYNICQKEDGRELTALLERKVEDAGVW